MNPLVRRTLAATALLMFLASNLLFADGKIYVKLEEVPTNIPYQRATILHDQGQQTLILQSQFEVTNQTRDKSMVWIVPVPAVPDIESADADVTNMDPFLRLDLLTGPKVHHLSQLLVLIWLLLTALTPVLLITSKLVKGKEFQHFLKRIENPLSAIVLSGFGVILVFGTFGSAASRSGNTVEIINAVKAGIHDVKVIQADNADALIDWFRENGFPSGPEDKIAIQSYISRGWCFVASRIHPQTTTTNRHAVSNHLLAPLILTFKSPHPVYPTALTATGGHRTEILIYLATNTPYSTQSPMALRRQRNLPGRISYYVGTADSIKQRHFDFKYLSKYKSTLTPEEMTQDIEFLPGPEMPEYREELVDW